MGKGPLEAKMATRQQQGTGKLQVRRAKNVLIVQTQEGRKGKPTQHLYMSVREKGNATIISFHSHYARTGKR